MGDVSPAEQSLIDLLCERTKSTAELVVKETDKPFDIHVAGTREESFGEIKFTAWLPLWTIRNLVEWTSPRIAAMSDYPEMALSGDWSAIRDSDNENIWAIFNDYTQHL